MVLCEMYHARQSPRPVLIKSLQKSSFIGQISQYFPAREVCDWSVLTKLSLCMGLVPRIGVIIPPRLGVPSPANSNYGVCACICACMCVCVFI